MNDYNILALGWLEKKCHFGTKLRKDWCHFGTICWRLGLALRRFQGGSRLRAGLASNSPPDCSPTAKLLAHRVTKFKQKTQPRGLGFPFDTATWARTKDLLLRRQLLYPTELLPHALKYISFFADLCKGRKKDCRNNVRQPKS